MDELDEIILTLIACEIESKVLKSIFDQCQGCIQYNLSQNEHNCLDVDYKKILNEKLQDLLLAIESNIMKKDFLEILSCDDDFISALKLKLLH